MRKYIFTFVLIVLGGFLIAVPLEIWGTVKRQAMYVEFQPVSSPEVLRQTPRDDSIVLPPASDSASEDPAASSDKAFIIRNADDVLKYVSEEKILQSCRDVYPSGQNPSETGRWLSRYWDFLVAEGTGEVASAKNSPLLFPLPSEGTPRCVIALYYEEGNPYLLYEDGSGIVKLPLLESKNPQA